MLGGSKREKTHSSITFPEANFVWVISSLDTTFEKIRCHGPDLTLETLQQLLSSMKDDLTYYFSENDTELGNYIRTFYDWPFSTVPCYICFTEFEILLACCNIVKISHGLLKELTRDGHRTMRAVLLAKAVRKIATERLAQVKSMIATVITLFDDLKRSDRLLNSVVGDWRRDELAAEFGSILGKSEVKRSLDDFIESAKEGLDWCLTLELPKTES